MPKANSIFFNLVILVQMWINDDFLIQAKFAKKLPYSLNITLFKVICHTFVFAIVGQIILLPHYFAVNILLLWINRIKIF